MQIWRHQNIVKTQTTEKVEARMNRFVKEIYRSGLTKTGLELHHLERLPASVAPPKIKRTPIDVYRAAKLRV